MFSKKRFKNNQLETLLERSKLNVFLTLKYNVLHTFSYNVQSSVHFQTFKKRFQNVQQQRKITDKTKRLKPKQNLSLTFGLVLRTFCVCWVYVTNQKVRVIGRQSTCSPKVRMFYRGQNERG